MNDHTNYLEMERRRAAEERELNGWKVPPGRWIGDGTSDDLRAVYRELYEMTDKREERS